MTNLLEDTIAAIATPIGEAAISMIRVSGNKAIQNIAIIFRGKKDLNDVKSHTAHFGKIIDEQENAIDEVVCTVFKMPHSFTGENVVEVTCHGGTHITKRVFERIIETGIRPALPGEFSKRAFLNGKIDLSQAEAIADLIHAQSDKAYRTSIEQLEGRLSVEINSIRNKLIELLGILELELDFIEENIELIEKKNVEDRITDILCEVEQLLKTYKYGKVWREGIKVAIIGSPNAGKSSLLNALLKKERAIVTEIPGTTRDFIEEKILINGVMFRLIDTAGLRATNDPIEKEGIKRTKKVAKNADVIILVHDSTKKFRDRENELIKEIIDKQDRKKVIIANNKIDLHKSMKINNWKGYEVVGISALTLKGLDDLEKKLSEIVIDNSIEIKETATITNERHYSALLRTKEGITLALNSIKNGESNEFITANIRIALNALGEIVGVVTTEEILNNIFSKFCIGK